MSEYLTESQTNTIKTALRDRIFVALTNKGHKVEYSGSCINSVDDQYIRVEFRCWGNPPSYLRGPAYAKAVEVVVEDGSYSRHSKTRRRTKGEGVLPESDVLELVEAIEEIVVSKIRRAEAEIKAKSSKENTIQFLTSLGLEVKYGETYIGKPYSSQEGTVKISETGSMNFALSVHHDDLERAKKIIELIRELNKNEQHEEADAA